MAIYTQPTTRILREFISPAIWNTDLVENIKYLKDQSDIVAIPGTNKPSSLVFFDIAEVSKNNDATLTTIATATIKGGLLGTNNGLLIMAAIDAANTVAGQTYTFEVDYGGTAILAPAASNGNNNNNNGMILTAFLKADNSNAVQRASGQLVIPNNPGVVNIAGATGTAAINSALDQILLVKFKMGTASANTTWTSRGVWVYYLPHVIN